MNYSDSIKAILLATINELAEQPEKYAVKPGVDFIRNRKMGFKDYMLMFLTMEGDCIREELYRFFGRTTEAPSKAAFYKQRKKIKEEAFRNLLLAFNKKLPKTLYNGKYELWACDGSSADIFLNPEDADTYFEPNGKSTRGFNQIHINAMFSLLDKRFTDILVQPARKRNEYSAFCSMVDSADVSDNSKIIFFGDRGYTSYNNFAHVIEKGQYFLIRCNDKRASGMLGYSVDSLPAFDENINLILTRSKAVKNYSRPEMFSAYRYVYQNAPMDYLNDIATEYDIAFRLLRIQLDDGTYENIATNLPRDEFQAEDFKALYHLRWNEENSFRDLKYPLCLKSFHSKKYEYIVQEVWARAILYNFSSSITANITVDRADCAYEYQVNYSSALKTCRDFLRIHDRTTKINVEGLIAQNIEPIRPGRSFARQHKFKLPMTFCYRN